EAERQQVAAPPLCICRPREQDNQLVERLGGYHGDSGENENARDRGRSSSAKAAGARHGRMLNAPVSFRHVRGAAIANYTLQQLVVDCTHGYFLSNGNVIGKCRPLSAPKGMAGAAP